jgi:hypothetical protein
LAGVRGEGRTSRTVLLGRDARQAPADSLEPALLGLAGDRAGRDVDDGPATIPLAPLRVGLQFGSRTNIVRDTNFSSFL